MTILLLAGMLLSFLPAGQKAAAAQGQTSPFARAGFSAPASSSTTTSSPANIQDFSLVSPEEGWLRLDGRLYWTRSGGSEWIDITPPGSESLLSAFFLEHQSGWAVLASGQPGSGRFTIARTQDGGTSWVQSEQQLFQPGEVDALVSQVFLQFIDAQTGWGVFKRATGVNFSLGTLFATTDGGVTWTRLELPLGEPVSFIDSQVGWVAGGPAGDELYRTLDGGRTWQPQQPLDGSAEKHYFLPVFSSARDAILPVLSGGADAPRLDLLETTDQGKTWTADASRSTPLKEPSDNLSLSAPGMGQWIGMVAGSGSLFTFRNGGEVQMIPNPDPLAAGIVRLEMASNETGWAQASSGNCTAPGECQVENLLLRTMDGGSTWQPLTLPQPPAGLAPAAPPTFIGQGFDKCEVANLSQYQAWWQYGPYRSVNLYIGGSSRGCHNSDLNANLVTQLALQGWNFIPTWVGPQAPCTSFHTRMSSDPVTAYTEGVAEANSAADVSSALGLKGGVIYYDLEAYTSNTPCRQVVSSFMNGWTAQLHARSHISGLYGSSCGSNINDMKTIANKPDGIWLANWIYDSYNSAADVWNVSCVSNNDWSQHQRIRQYNGTHTETWGGVAMTIDSNAVEGIVVDANNLPASICPTLGGVILYRDDSYSCSNLDERYGFVLRGSAGVQNLPNTFLGQASSVHAPDGWSVMLYEETNRGGGKKCIDSPGDDNFVGDTFDNGAIINDRVASFEVFTTTDCAPGAGPDTVAQLGDYDTPTDDVTVSVESSSTTYIQPGTVFDPSVVIRVTAGFLDVTRGDLLKNTGGDLLGASADQPVRTYVPQGSTYIFDTLNDPSFRMTAPSTPGTYSSQWAVMVNSSPVSPKATVQVLVDATQPVNVLSAPVGGTYLNTGMISLQANPTDNLSGIQQVAFYAGYDDGSGWKWHELGFDNDGSNGWGLTWNVSQVPDQTWVDFISFAWDKAWNGATTSAWNITLDRQPPVTAFQPLEAVQNSTKVYLRWTAVDAVSGLDHFDIQMQRDGGAWQDWQTNLSSATTSARFYGDMGHQYSFRIRGVDKAGNAESYLSKPEISFTISTCTGDSYELDNTFDLAKPITANELQPHTICGQGDGSWNGDIDWAKLPVEAGISYMLMTTQLGETTDTVLALYDADGNKLAENDDIVDGVDLASRIFWTATQSGFVYLRVRHFDNRVAGSGVTYTLWPAVVYHYYYLPVVIR